MSIAGKGQVSAILEHVKLRKWVKVSLSPRQYSGDINIEWMMKGEVSVASMGFFAKTQTSNKLANLVGLLPVELLYGFQFVKTFVMKNLLRVSPPNSWRLDHKMRSTGVYDIDPSENLDPKFIFSRYFDIFAVHEYCLKRVERSQMKTTEKSPPKKGRKPSVATAARKDATSKDKAASLKEKPPPKAIPPPKS